MALPAPSAELCFSTDVFLEDGFTVDSFVSQCRQHVTIEHLRDDLESYFKTLKAAMVELINKDYADFVDLSTNLVCFLVCRCCWNELKEWPPTLLSAWPRLEWTSRLTAKWPP